jgi:hypothetical protein
MGIDLTLLPIDDERTEDVWYSHSVLVLERWNPLYDAIRALGEERAIPETFLTLLGQRDEYTNYGNTQYTRTGEDVGWLFVGELLTVNGHPGVTDVVLNAAAWAYLQQLPSTMKVALYWDD